MSSKNILLVGPKEVIGDIVNVEGLPCKVLVIHDGFKALVGLLKLLSSGRPVDGIYLHALTSRVELPSYMDAIRAIEKGLGRSPVPICLAFDQVTSAEKYASDASVDVVSLPSDGDDGERFSTLTQQLANLAGGGGA